VAKAKTPSTGGDKPVENPTSRASSAASKPKTVRKAPAKTTKAGAKADSATTPASASPKTTAPSSAPQDATTSSAIAAKQAEPSAPQADAPRGDVERLAVKGETQVTTETDEVGKSADKPNDKKAESAKSEGPAKTAIAPTSPTPHSAYLDEPEKRGSVFLPMILGGIIAGGIGFAAAELNVFGLRSDDAGQTALAQGLAAQEARIATLEQASTAPAAVTDTSEIETSIADLTARIDEIANRPAPSVGEPPKIDTSGFEAELAELKTSVETQRDEIEKLLDNALSVEEATAKAAQAATAQSAIARIVAAISTGQPFASEVAQLQESGFPELPQALTDAAETGVATSANLQDRFPDAARASLAAARADAPADAGGGLGSFLKNQLGARSVTPREGSDPDAILSRAEAAMRQGQLADALTEVEALPEGAKAPLADWIADAQTRQAAQDAVDTLAQSLTAN
jgi:hypothetical protein